MLNYPKEKKLIIFDMDGTILNTLDDITDAVNHYLDMYNYPRRSVEEMRIIVGRGLRNTLKEGFPAGTNEGFIDEIFPEFAAYYKEHSNDKTRPYDGVVEVIKKLKAEGYMTAVASNKRQEAVEVLGEIYFKDCFDMAIGDAPGRRIKPASDMTDEILKFFNVKKEDAVYIGDSDVDVQTARNAGLDLISVTWGFRDREMLEKIGADYFISTPGEIVK